MKNPTLDINKALTITFAFLENAIKRIQSDKTNSLILTNILTRKEH